MIVFVTPFYLKIFSCTVHKTDDDVHFSKIFFQTFLEAVFVEKNVVDK